MFTRRKHASLCLYIVEPAQQDCKTFWYSEFWPENVSETGDVLVVNKVVSGAGVNINHDKEIYASSTF